jgi:hypothetical protein
MDSGSWPVYQYVQAQLDDLGVDSEEVFAGLPCFSDGHLTYSLVRRDRGGREEEPVKLTVAGMAHLDRFASTVEMFLRVVNALGDRRAAAPFDPGRVVTVEIPAPHPVSPLGMVAAFDYLDVVWQLKFGRKLLRVPSAERAARLALVVSTPEEFDNRLRLRAFATPRPGPPIAAELAWRRWASWDGGPADLGTWLLPQQLLPRQQLGTAIWPCHMGFARSQQGMTERFCPLESSVTYTLSCLNGSGVGAGGGLGLAVGLGVGFGVAAGAASLSRIGTQAVTDTSSLFV